MMKEPLRSLSSAGLKTPRVSRSLSLNLDKLPDGTWRLIWDKNLLEEFAEFKSLEMIRENS